MDEERGADAARWTATNLVGVPASLLAGTAFNAAPQPLHVAGVREAHAGLFERLARCDGLAEARKLFARHMSDSFALTPLPVLQEVTADPPHRWRPSYLKLLQGWGLDSNGGAGAVLKGWAQSRFGVIPVFHKVALGRFPSPAWVAYLEEKAANRYEGNYVFHQLDLLFEFCQWALARHGLLGAGPRVTLWRGSNRCEEQIVAGSLRQRHCTVRLNSLVSFSTTREQAGCFGDWLLRAEVPLTKLLLVPGLLDTNSLRGEAEVLAIGGLYEVEASYA
ncbi:NAD(+)--dinitrogen-reductase ADP-D-ribosyltransferase [Rubrivivax sp. A210]|uniref:NAD(+)--dinitrogen-reductase ADP-D-ribosyltransferase n=1 Tax=Rubrivivax sp. A210 TaxID=2772301 RepID=UPI001919C2DA|nr:NAD(+)--dinitrogen-reductase ADP-D-ribosyltransferase [Rubrivivax sp. A210]CAD5371948.1 NAD(+)--dinitrogen-reductase ADP-D-ribosyltransferase [Rubrivivax sp. A210]